MTSDDRFAPYSTADGVPTPLREAPPAALRVDDALLAAPLPPAHPSPSADGPRPSLRPPGAWPAQPRAAGDLPAWAVVLIAVAGSVVVLGVLAAVALPVFLQQRAVTTTTTSTTPAPRTSFALPPRLAGLPRLIGDPAMDAQLAKTAVECRCDYSRYGAYRNASRTRTLLVFMGRRSAPADVLTQRDTIDQYWTGFSQSVGSQGGSVDNRHELAPGPLGGTLTCAQMRSSVMSGWACLAVNAETTVSFMMAGPRGSVAPLTPTLALAVRESVELRH